MSDGPLFPVVQKDAAFAPPAEADTYFVLAENGIFMERRTDLYTATVPAVGGVPGLLPHAPRLVLRLPRLPRSLVERAVGFFRAVHQHWDGEGILMMYYRPATASEPIRYRLDAPPQRIRGRWDRGRFRADLHLDYDRVTLPVSEWRELGTFHSHGPVSPYHSATDADDEQFGTGLHLTAGYVQTTRPEFAAAFVVGGTRFRVTPEMVLAPFHAARPWPSAWLGRVKVIEEKWSSATWGSGVYAGWRANGSDDSDANAGGPIR